MSRRPRPPRRRPSTGTATSARRRTFVDWPAFWAKDRSEPEWVVEHVLARRRGHAIWAKGGNGKSEFAQWLALRAIEGGHVVVYLDYEMIDDDLFDRLVDFGAGPETDLARLRYALIPSSGG